jgi:hypothetical protein
MEPQPSSRARRWAWFVAIYAGSLVTFTLLVYGLRAIVPR